MRAALRGLPARCRAGSPERSPANARSGQAVAVPPPRGARSGSAQSKKRARFSAYAFVVLTARRRPAQLRADNHLSKAEPPELAVNDSPVRVAGSGAT